MCIFLVRNIPTCISDKIKYLHYMQYEGRATYNSYIKIHTTSLEASNNHQPSKTTTGPPHNTYHSHIIQTASRNTLIRHAITHTYSPITTTSCNLKTQLITALSLPYQTAHTVSSEPYFIISATSSHFYSANPF